MVLLAPVVLALLAGLASIVFYGVSFALGGDGEAFFRSPASGWLLASFYLLILPAAAPAMALMIGLTGGSPGKWIFGVKVLGADGRPIGFRRALMRELDICVRGCGVALTPITVVTIWMTSWRLEGKGATLWDERQDNIILHRPWSARTRRIAVALVIAMAVLSYMLRFLQHAWR